MNESSVDAVAYGGAGLGIGEQYPVEVWGTPNGSPEQSASRTEMCEAGFDRPAHPETKLIDQHGNEVDIGSLRYFVLRDDGGQIVATWDEGRWWSLAESEALIAAMVNPAVRQMAEATHSFTELNREQRRRKGKGGA